MTALKSIYNSLNRSEPFAGDWAAWFGKAGQNSEALLFYSQMMDILRNKTHSKKDKNLILKGVLGNIVSFSHWQIPENFRLFKKGQNVTALFNGVSRSTKSLPLSDISLLLNSAISFSDQRSQGVTALKEAVKSLAESIEDFERWETFKYPHTGIEEQKAVFNISRGMRPKFIAISYNELASLLSLAGHIGLSRESVCLLDKSLTESPVKLGWLPKNALQA